MATSGRNVKPMAPNRVDMNDSFHPGVAKWEEVAIKSQKRSSKQEKHNAMANCQHTHSVIIRDEHTSE